MRHLETSNYRKVNDSFHRRLVYHAGIDCGFFVELNYMVNAMLYCLSNGYRFQLYSEDANFGTGKGWTEYFVPFCHHQEFERLSPQVKKESIIRLLFSVDILLHSSAFVGTITSGPSVFVMKVRADDPYVTAIDCSDHPKPLLTQEGKKKIRISGRICGFFYLMLRIE